MIYPEDESYSPVQVAPPDRVPLQVRVDAGTISHQQGQEVQSSVHSSHNMGSQQSAPAKSAGILSTYLSSYGSPTGSYDDKGSVDVGDGFRTSLAVAASLGLVRADGNGGWTDVVGAPSASQQVNRDAQQEQQQEAPAGPELFSPADETSWGETIADMAQPIYDSAISHGIAAAVQGGDLSSVVSMLQATGMEPSRAQAVVDEGAAKFRGQMDSILTKEFSVGDPEAFYQWCREHNPDGLMDAATQHATIRNLGPLRQLADNFRRSVAPSESVFRRAGYETKVGSDKSLLILWDGQWRAASELARSGQLH